MTRNTSSAHIARCWSIAETAVGQAVILASATGISRIEFLRLNGGQPDLWGDSLPEPLVEIAPEACRNDSRLAEATRALSEIIDGTRRDFPFVLDLTKGTAFDRRVWNELRRIPYGQTRSYGAVARAIGRGTGASRAVGGACGRNPLPVVIPCHRVLAHNGTLGGYSGGLDIKAHLLRVEGVLLV